MPATTPQPKYNPETIPQKTNMEATQHEPVSLEIAVDGTVFLVRHIYTGSATLDDVYFEFLSRKITDL